MLLAHLIDATNTVAYILVQAHGGKAPPPKPYPRPGAGPARKRLTPAGADYLTRLRAGRGVAGHGS